MDAKSAFAIAAQAKLDSLPTNVAKRDFDKLMDHIKSAAERGEFYVSFGNSHITWPGSYELPFYMWSFDDKLAHNVRVVKERQHLLRDTLISLIKEHGFVVECKNTLISGSITISWEKV